VHPLKVEAVCAIGYRADILACLVGFIGVYVVCQAGEGRMVIHLFFFLALFSKESALVFPVLIAAYDWSYGPGRVIFRKYWGFLGMTAFYLFLYFFVFRNTTLIQHKFIGGRWLFMLSAVSISGDSIDRSDSPVYGQEPAAAVCAPHRGLVGTSNLGVWFGPGFDPGLNGPPDPPGQKIGFFPVVVLGVFNPGFQSGDAA